MTQAAAGAPTALLLITRPGLTEAGHEGVGVCLRSEGSASVLDHTLAQRLGVAVAAWPAFDLCARAQAAADIHRWLSQGAVSDGRDLVVFVSPGALDLARAAFPAEWPASLLCGLMGDGSAAKAQSLGIPPAKLIYPRQALGQSQDAASLLDCLRRQQPASGYGRILLVKGPAGNPSLPGGLRGLASQGLTVCEAYDRRPVADGAGLALRLRQHWQIIAGADKPMLVLYLTSSEAASTLVPVLRAEAATLPSCSMALLATHPKIAESVLAAGGAQPVVLAPGPQALNDWLLQHFGPSGA